MARFRFSGTIRRVTVEYIDIEEGIIDVTKKSVCEEFDLPNVVDGDSTHWIDEAERAVDYGVPFKVVDANGAEWETIKVTNEAKDIAEMEYDS